MDLNPYVVHARSREPEKTVVSGSAASLEAPARSTKRSATIPALPGPRQSTSAGFANLYRAFRQRCYHAAVNPHSSQPALPAPQVRRVRIGAEEAGQRIDNYLIRELRGVPRSRLYRLLRRGEVRVNGGRVEATYRLAEGDELRLPPVRVSADDQSRPGGRLLERLADSILYEDDRVLVLNKPAGVAVHGGSGVVHGVIEGLRALRPQAPFLELVHRLDRDTSGCLMLAKKRSALRELHGQLREQRLEKRYLALLAGKLPRGRIPVEAALERSQLRGGERMVKVDGEGRHARSLFRTVERFAGATLAEVDIATGRTHQIRVHAAHLGHPVVGDDKYGDREINRQFRHLGLRRLFLHAQSLSLRWKDGGELSLVAPLSEDLQRVVETLRNGSRGG